MGKKAISTITIGLATLAAWEFAVKPFLNRTLKGA